MASPPARLDLGHHLVRGLRRAAGAVHRAAEVVDHHLGAAPGQLQRVLAAEAAAGAGHDRHLAVEADVRHGPKAPSVKVGGLMRGARRKRQAARPLMELHQHALADQERRAVGADHHLDHAVVGALRRDRPTAACARRTPGRCAAPCRDSSSTGRPRATSSHRLADRDERLVALGHLGAHDALAGRLEVEHRRDVQGRGADAGVGVAAHDHAVDRRADDGLLERVAGLGELGLRPRRRRRAAPPAWRWRCASASCAWSTCWLETNRGGDQRLQPVVSRWAALQLDVGRARSAALAWARSASAVCTARRGASSSWRASTWPLVTAVALLDVDVADDAGGAGGDLDDAALDVGLAVGDGRVGRRGRGAAGVAPAASAGASGSRRAPRGERRARRARRQDGEAARAWRQSPTGSGAGSGGGVGGRLVRQDAAVLEVDDAVGEGFQARVVGDADHRRAVLRGGAAQQAHDHLAVLAVERRGRLVGEQQAAALGERAGDGDALLLAAGELATGRWFMRGSRPTSVSASIARSRGRLALSCPCSAARWSPARSAVSAGNRLKPWKMKPQWSSRKRSIVPGRRLQRSCAQRVDRALVGPQQARQRRDQRRLARARRAHDHGHLAVPRPRSRRRCSTVDVGAAGLEALGQALGDESAWGGAGSSQQVRGLALLQDAHRQRAGGHRDHHQHDADRPASAGADRRSAGRWRWPAAR